MIQVSDQEFALMLELVNRAPKTSGEVYALQVIVEKANAQQAEQKREAQEKSVHSRGD